MIVGCILKQSVVSWYQKLGRARLRLVPKVDDADIILGVLEAIFRSAASIVANARNTRKALLTAQADSTTSDEEPLRKAS